MVRLFFLLLPGLIPSWEFFKAIEPSPRVQWRLFAAPLEDGEGWNEFRPRPQKLSLLTILRRLIWNPRWNDSLYLVSLSERLMLIPNQHSVDEIFDRLNFYISAPDTAGDSPLMLQFRLIFVRREGEQITESITYMSEPRICRGRT
jgi:hypothetical protein